MSAAIRSTGHCSFGDEDRLSADAQRLLRAAEELEAQSDNPACQYEARRLRRIALAELDEAYKLKSVS